MKVELGNPGVPVRDCPFCGSLSLAHGQTTKTEGGSTKKVWFVWCMNCDAQGPEVQTFELACVRWNEQRAVNRAINRLGQVKCNDPAVCHELVKIIAILKGES